MPVGPDTHGSQNCHYKDTELQGQPRAFLRQDVDVDDWVRDVTAEYGNVRMQTGIEFPKEEKKQHCGFPSCTSVYTKGENSGRSFCLAHLAEKMN